MFGYRTMGLLILTTLIAACNGGGGGGGGGGSSLSHARFNENASSAIGSACGNYTMNSTNCAAIGGTWSTNPVAATFVCKNPSAATKGKCHLEGLRFSALSTPLSVEAISKCEGLGGIVTPTTSSDCTSAGGSWEIDAAATSVTSCNRAPANVSECNLVGGQMQDLRRMEGNISPYMGQDIVSGKVRVHTTIDANNTDYVFQNSPITEVSGTVTLMGDMGGDLWVASVPVSRASNFRYSEGYAEFDINFGKDLATDASNNGIYVTLTVTYAEDL